jgi:hypothetical protein
MKPILDEISKYKSVGLYMSTEIKWQTSRITAHHMDHGTEEDLWRNDRTNLVRTGQQAAHSLTIVVITVLGHSHLCRIWQFCVIGNNY